MPSVLFISFLISIGSNARMDTRMQTGISIRAICVDTGSFSPLSNVQIGRIKAESIMLAPTIFPTDNEDSFFIIAVMVVTNSGSDVPIATIVTDIMFSLICNFSAISQADCTSSSEPATIATAPMQNQMTVFHNMISFFFLYCASPGSLFFLLTAFFTFSI